MSDGVEVRIGRIERLAVEAIVNAANTALIRGGGVDGAIRAAAGEKIEKALAAFPGLSVGEAVLTAGFKLPARWVIHTAAPVWGVIAAEDADAGLGACYDNALRLAAASGIRALAFPALGTGAFGWPKGRAAAIAVQRIRARPAAVARVILCAFTEEDAGVLRAALSGQTPSAE